MRRLDAVNFEGYGCFREGELKRGAHRIRWYASGNPRGTPIIFCHGGPGGLNRPFYRTMFDPDKWCLIQIEQRGNSVSVPAGELENNTTLHLIEDMEDVREEMGIERWLVGGGSWGSTLAITYAETHRERARGLLLVCMWLGRLRDIDFWFDAGQWVYPECYEQLVDGMNENEQKNIAATLFDRVLHGAPEVASDAARRIYLWRNRLTGEYMRFSWGFDESFLLNSESFPFMTAYRLDWLDTQRTNRWAYRLFTWGFGLLALALAFLAVRAYAAEGLRASLGHAFVCLCGAISAFGTYAAVNIALSLNEPELQTAIPAIADWILALPFVAGSMLLLYACAFVTRRSRPTGWLESTLQAGMILLFVAYLYYLNHWNALGWNYP